MKFLVSAGEASGDMYASGVVRQLAERLPGTTYHGCAGPLLKSAGVEPVVDAASLAVVGLAEVVRHLPRIWGEYRKLVRFAKVHEPRAALLTDSPDFHLRVAKHLKRQQIPVFYLVAPQVWAWRQGRVKQIREVVDKLFCLFPFEERWFRERGVDATYIGHPLASRARVSCSRDEFFFRHDIAPQKRIVVLLPGSRSGEMMRHLPVLFDTAGLLGKRAELAFVLATPPGFRSGPVFATFRERIEAQSIKVVENETWDCIGHADVALAASGTVTMEAAILSTPMVTFYKVNGLSWWAGRGLVKVPFLSMVNLVADRQIVPELMQTACAPENLAREADRLLTSSAAADRMRADLSAVRTALTREGDPLQRVAEIIGSNLGEMVGTVSGVSSGSGENVRDARV